MQATELDPRTLLKRFLDECALCRQYFLENVSSLVGDGVLSDDQVVWVLVKLNDFHKQH